MAESRIVLPGLPRRPSPVEALGADMQVILGILDRLRRSDDPAPSATLKRVLDQLLSTTTALVSVSKELAPYRASDDEPVLDTLRRVLAECSATEHHG